MVFIPLKQAPNYGTTLVTPVNAFPTTLAASGVYDSGLLPAGFSGVTAAVTSDQAGVLTLNRYADLAGLVLINATTQAIVGGTPASIFLSDGAPYISFNVSFSNTSGVTANITNVAILTGGGLL
jgi:hypothetical protein